MKRSSNEALRSGGYNNRPFDLRELTALWIGKLFIVIFRILGRGGTTLPGGTALKISPLISSKLARRLKKGCILVTGTNGKTTTASLISAIIKEAGYHCIHNQSGSNMAWGIASTLIEEASLTGNLNADFAVMEVDEGALQKVTESVNPNCIVVTNIFRDQLDRYGEVDKIQDTIKRGLDAQQSEGYQVINADDPSLVGILEPGKQHILTYGIQLDIPDDTFQNTGRDMKTCPHCLKKLTYNKIFYAHLGHYHCQSCHYQRPEPDVKLIEYNLDANGSAKLLIDAAGDKLAISFSLMGTYNLYNLLAAVSCAKSLAIPSSSMAASLEKAMPSFGRMESFKVGNKSITVALIKNPVGANEVLRTLLTYQDNFFLLVAINDKIADGTDVSWLWDVDFEKLASEEACFAGLMVSGLRAWDMAVRFKYAGFKTNSINVEEDIRKAIKISLAQTPEGATLFILPTYTAMLEARLTLNKMGLGKPYWEG